MTILVAICDVLEADGGWMDGSLICDEVVARYPQWKRESVRRSLNRLTDRGAIERRLSAVSVVGTGSTSRQFNPARAIFRLGSDPWSVVNEYETRGGC